jgi:hypothetical protein
VAASSVANEPMNSDPAARTNLLETDASAEAGGWIEARDLDRTARSREKDGVDLVLADLAAAQAEDRAVRRTAHWLSK